MRTEHLVESVPKTLTLDRETADSLSRLGRSLASRRGWWGEDVGPDDDRTVIRCTSVDQDRWRVRVSDAVGAVGAGDLRIIVAPKIPPRHLFYLFAEAKLLPRIDPRPAVVGGGDDLWEVLASWYVTALEVLLRQDLLRDYVPHLEPLPFVRGQVLALETANAYYSGRLELICDYEDFGTDTPLNRVLRAAVDLVSSSRTLDFSLRRRARVASDRFSDVGQLRPSDMGTRPERRTAHYSDALTLARHIITNFLREIAEGEEVMWSFLIRTPELVEQGIRESLDRRLRPEWPVVKRKIPLPPSALTMNPDLDFGGSIAVGDVKYRHGNRGDWVRSDLNQIIAFAAAAHCVDGAVISFYWGEGGAPPPVQVGDFRIRSFGWRADEHVGPEEAADALAADVQAWLVGSVAAG